MAHFGQNLARHRFFRDTQQLWSLFPCLCRLETLPNVTESLNSLF